MSDLKDGYGGPEEESQGMASDDAILSDAMLSDGVDDVEFGYSEIESVDLLDPGVDPFVEGIVEDRYSDVSPEGEIEYMESITGESEVFSQAFRESLDIEVGDHYTEEEKDQIQRSKRDELFVTPLEDVTFAPPLSRGIRTPGYRQYIPVTGPAQNPFWQRIQEQKAIAKKIQDDFDEEWDQGNYINAISGFLDNLKQSADSIPTLDEVVETGQFFVSRGPERGERKGLSRKVEQATSIGAGLGAGIGAGFGIVKGFAGGGPPGAVIGGLGGTMLGGMLGAGATYFTAASFEEDTVSPFLLRMYSLSGADKAIRQSSVNLSQAVTAVTVDNLVDTLADLGVDVQPKVDELNAVATEQLQKIADDQREGKVFGTTLTDRVGQLTAQSFLEIMQFALEKPELRAKILRDRERVSDLQKPDDLTWEMIGALRIANEDFGTTPEEQEAKKAYVQAKFSKIMHMASYEALPEPLRRDRIPLDKFKTLISDGFDRESLDEPIFQASPFFREAALSVLNDEPDEAIQGRLDKVPFGSFSHLQLFDMLKSDKHSVFPDDATVRNWAQEHQTATRIWGSDATINIERTLGRMMMTPTKMGDEVYMPESTFAMLMRMTTWAPSAIAEIDFAGQSQLSLNDKGQWEAANERVVNFLTPASYDRAHNLGVRDFQAGYFARLAAAIRTGNIGYQPAIADIMRAKGMKPNSEYWQLFQYLGLAMDFLVPWEKPYLQAVGKIAGATTATPRMLRNSKNMPKGHRAKMLYAQVAPGLYSRAKGLQDSDPLTAVHNVILEAQRDLHAKGDNSRPYLDQIQKEQVDEVLRVAGLQPKDVHEANEKLFEVIRQARVAGLQRGLGSVGTPGVAASRQSPGFQRFRQALSDAMDQGIIPRDQYAHIVAQFERQAAVIANDPTIPEIQTISDFFEAFELTLGRQPGPGARFMEGPAEPGYVHMAPKTEAARRLVEADAARAPEAPAGRPIVENFFTEAAISNARRADEIPNSRDRLVYLTPDEFLRLAEPLDAPFAPKAEAIQRDMGLGEKFPDVPHLKMNEEGRIVDHDGRHRVMALRDRGVDRIPVRLESKGGKGEIRWNRQNQPGLNAGREYVDGLPTELIGQDGTSRIKAPYYTEGPNRGQVLPEYSGAPRAPEAPAGREIPPQMRAETAGARTPDEIAEARRLWREQGTESPYFQRWFGDSKVVDEAGEPMVVYHGGGDVEGGSGSFRVSRRGALGRGIYFTPSRARATDYAIDFAIETDTPGNIFDGYVSIKNPLILGDQPGHPMINGFVKLGMDRKRAIRLVERVEEQHGYIGSELQNAAKEQGYDGIIQYDGPGKGIAEVVAFDPTQVKSTRNRGTFDPADSRVRYMRGPGKVPMGFFEWDPQTSRFIINLYRNADMNVLWHENGHLLATIMGRRWSSKLFKFFDHAIDGQGKVKLTSRGHEELAEAWRMYRKVRDSRHGPVRRLFDQLWLEIRNLYYSLRGQPGALPRQAIRIWDLEFGPDPRIVAYSVQVANQIAKNKRPRLVIDSDIAQNIEEAYGKRYGASRERRRGRLDPETVRQALGLKFESFVDTMPDGTRIPRRRLADQSVDALDVYEKALAFVMTEDIRSKIGFQKILRPTARTMIPEERANRLNQSVRDRMIQAFGMNAKELSKQVRTRKYQKEVGFVWREMSELGDNITQADVDALATRMRIQTGNKFDPEAVHNIELIALKDEQAAGFHTLVHELAAEPMGNRIPDGMLDPDTSFRLVEINEFERIVDTLIDVEAGIGARASRRIEAIPDSLITRFMQGFSAGAEKASSAIPYAKNYSQKIKRFFEIPTFGKDYFDDGVRDIIESGMRRLGTLDQWVLSTQRRLKGEDTSFGARIGFNKNGFVSLVTDLRRQLTPIVDPGQVRSLFSIRDELNKVSSAMNTDAAARIARGETMVGLEPDVAGVSVQYLYTKIDRIQALLGDWYGMTPNERIAVNTVRQYKLRPADSLTDVELYKLADSIQTIKMGIDAKYRAVDAKGRKIWQMMGGDKDAGRAAELQSSEVRDIYLDFYNGNFGKLWNRAALQNLEGFDVNKLSLFDPNKAFLEMVVRMRAEEIIEELSRDLAEYGLNGELRSLSNFKELGNDASFDRDFFGQRVEHHINQIVTWRDRDLMEAEGITKYRKTKGKSAPPRYTGKYFAAQKVPAEKWGTVESATKQITDPYDFLAQTVATEILYKWGFKFGKGKWEFVEMPDGTKQLMPQMVAREIETALDRAAGVGQGAYKGMAWAWNMNPKHNFGTAVVGQAPKLKTRLTKGLLRVVDTFFELFPLTTRRISTGVTVGHGLLPVLPYYGGVTLGVHFQNYMSRGFVKASLDAAAMAPTMAGATAAIGSRALTGGRVGYRPDMVGAVMARMWKDGEWRPEATPVITKNFRILTADHIAELSQQYGLKSSFIEAENAETLMKKIYEAYPTDAVGKLQQPFKWYQTFKIEAATFIDNYIRLRIFIDELRMGRRPSDAARIAKKTAFDYSELSEAEKAWARNIILFYSYFRKNADLFWDTAVKNPERILGQLRLIAGSQRVAAQGEEEALVFPAYAQTRAIGPTLGAFYNTQRYKGINYMAPYLPVPDMLMIPANMYDAMFLDGEMQSKGYRDLLSRLNPLLQSPFVSGLSQDIYFNRNVNRGSMQVPAHVILEDYALTGGILWDFLGIKPVPIDQIRNPVYQEVQGRTVFVATDGGNYWLWKNLNQVAGGGRYAQFLWDLDKMNLGYVELKNRLLLSYLETTNGGLLQNTGWLTLSSTPGDTIGKPSVVKTARVIPETVEPGDIYYDTAWPRPGSMEKIGQRVPDKFADLVGLPPNEAIAELRLRFSDDNVMMAAVDEIATDILTPREKSERLMSLYGAKDIVDPSALSLRELPALFGFRPVNQQWQQEAANQILKRHKRMVERAAAEQVKKLEKSQDREN